LSTPLATTHRPDGRYATTEGFVQHLMLQKPALAFDPTADFAAWKKKVR
jgi:hypothetical protein